MTDPDRELHEETGGDAERFEVRAQAEIVHILRHAIERRALISVYRAGGADIALTTLLEVDPERDEMLFDVPQREGQAARLADAVPLTFVTSEQGIKIRFQVAGAAVRLYEEHPALVSPLPRVLLRLQRREFFRISTPLTDPPLCAIPHSGVDPGAELAVLNVSLGGVALMDQHPTLHLDTGQQYQGCRITLPRIGMFATGIEVRSCQEITMRNGLRARRAGCQLISPDRSAAGLLQRYITRLERARNPRFGKT